MSLTFEDADGGTPLLQPSERDLAQCVLFDGNTAEARMLAEKEALKGKMNSYGKTWHTWMTGMRDHQPDPLPYGPPRLQWSFNRDGEDMPGMVAERDKRMSFDTADEKKDREPVPGVTDNGDAATRPVPTFGMKNGQSTHSRAPAGGSHEQPDLPRRTA